LHHYWLKLVKLQSSTKHNKNREWKGQKKLQRLAILQWSEIFPFCPMDKHCETTTIDSTATSPQSASPAALCTTVAVRCRGRWRMNWLAGGRSGPRTPVSLQAGVVCWCTTKPRRIMLKWFVELFTKKLKRIFKKCWSIFLKKFFGPIFLNC
jgi:hypothetical protein